MAGSPIDIIVKDKVDVSIADNLRKIGQAATEAGASVDNQQGFLFGKERQGFHAGAN